MDAAIGPHCSQMLHFTISGSKLPEESGLVLFSMSGRGRWWKLFFKAEIEETNHMLLAEKDPPSLRPGFIPGLSISTLPACTGQILQCPWYTGPLSA